MPLPSTTWAVRSPRAQILLWLALSASAAQAGQPVPELSQEHRHPTGGFSFRTPADWTVRALPDRLGAIEASSGPLLVRLIRSEGEHGYDAAHEMCLLERLAPPMAFDLRVRYEYEFVGGLMGERRILDSAFVVRYDPPLQGQAEWRQRALTVVGEGETLCLVSAAPRSVWKQAAARGVLDGILASISFRKPADPGPR
jgi:hypothetical protein